MQPFRKSSLVQQPDGEITRAVVDAGSQPVAEFGIQFDLGMLGRKVAQDDPTSQKDLLFQAEAPQESSPGIGLLTPCSYVNNLRIPVQQS